MAQDVLEPHAPAHGSDPGTRLGTAGWALFIIWMGIVFLAGVPGWAALMGIGVITLVVQSVRKATGLPMEGFWVVVGLLFLLAAIWDLRGSTVPLLPVLLVAGGAALLMSLIRHPRG